MNDDRMRELFREMRDEPVPPDSLARVRMGVAARTAVAPRRFGWLWWGSAAAVAAVALLVLVMVWKSPQPLEVKPQVASSKPVEAPKVVQSRVIPDPPVVRTVRARRPSPVAKPAVGGAVAIRIETPDPDIVILLLGDEGPGE